MSRSPERSEGDEAISKERWNYCKGLLRFARNDGGLWLNAMMGVWVGVHYSLYGRRAPF